MNQGGCNLKNATAKVAQRHRALRAAAGLIEEIIPGETSEISFEVEAERLRIHGRRERVVAAAIGDSELDHRPAGDTSRTAVPGEAEIANNRIICVWRSSSELRFRLSVKLTTTSSLT
jgi:hypothetical protein